MVVVEKDKLSIYFKGEVGDNQSWGISTIGNVQGFLSLNHNVYIEAMNRYGNVPADIESCLSNTSPDYDVFIRQGLAEHMHELAHINKQIVRISLSCWDSSLISEEAAEIHNKHCDGVLALSEFTRDAFRGMGVNIPIHIGGQGYDESLFYPEEIRKERPFTFVTVAVAQGRKGTHALINSFEKAFSDNDNVKLIIKSNSWGSLKDYGVNSKNIEKVYAEYTREELAELYRSCDCFVLPTEGDSFALPGLEAMASGLPLIITGFGGPRDYCTDETGYRINFNLKDAGYLNGLQAVVDEEHLVYLLKHVFENQNEALAKGKNGARIAKEYWTWKKDAERNISFFKALLAKKGQI